MDAKIQQAEVVADWAKILVERLQKKIQNYRIGGATNRTLDRAASNALYRSIKTVLAHEIGGDVGKVQLLYKFYGTFVDMGVGKSQKISDVKDAGALLRVVGGKGRRPKHWYSVTITAETNTLADLTMHYYGNKGTRLMVDENTQINL